MEFQSVIETMYIDSVVAACCCCLESIKLAKQVGADCFQAWVPARGFRWPHLLHMMLWLNPQFCFLVAGMCYDSELLPWLDKEAQLWACLSWLACL